MIRNRNFMTLLVGQLVSTFGNNLYSIALPWFVFSMTHSKTALAVVSFAGTIPMVLGMFSGVLVDRWPKFRTMMQADLIRFALALGMGVIAAKTHVLWPIVLICFLIQFVGTFFGPAAASVVPMLVGEDNITAAMGLNQSASAMAQLVGTLSGGVLLAVLHAPMLFALDALTFLVSVASLLWLPYRRRQKEPTSPSSQGEPYFQSLKAGLEIFRISRFLVFCFISALIVNFAFAPLDFLLTAWVKETIRGTAFDLALINAALFLGMISGGLILGFIVKRLSLRNIFLIALSTVGLALAGMGVWPNLAVSIALTACMGLVISVLNGGFMGYMNEIVPEDMRGRAFATLGALFALTVPLGVAVGGICLTHLPIPTIWLCMGALSLLAGLLFLHPSVANSVRAKQATGGSSVVDVTEAIE